MGWTRGTDRRGTANEERWRIVMGRLYEKRFGGVREEERERAIGE